MPVVLFTLFITLSLMATLICFSEREKKAAVISLIVFLGFSIWFTTACIICTRESTVTVHSIKSVNMNGTIVQTLLIDDELVNLTKHLGKFVPEDTKIKRTLYSNWCGAGVDFLKGEQITYEEVKEEKP